MIKRGQKMDHEEIDVQNLLNDMTEALQEAHEIQKKYAAKLDELEKENLFLSETITQNKLGLIATERRELLAENAKIKSDADRSISQANAIKDEYEQKLDKMSAMVKNIHNKQSNIDNYIDSEAKNKIFDLKQANSDILKKEREKLQKEYQKLETNIKQKLKIHRMATTIGIGIGAIGILLGFII